MKIVVVGAGYVGLSLSVLLAQNNEVTIVDVLSEKIEKINNRLSPIQDEDLEGYLLNKPLNLTATLDAKSAYQKTEFVIIATPTNYDSQKNLFDTTMVEQVIQSALSVNTTTTIVIKSTVPVGYTEKIRTKYNYRNILFSPEFLRESKALYDNLYPSRIIVGCPKNDGEIGVKANIFADLLKEGAIKKDIETRILGLSEAEAVKLFANTYLALRIAYFNELDTYAEVKKLNTKEIIEGVCLDPRIGMYYNNPSFGYGGYCLPKDTKQLLANYDEVPENLIRAIVESNRTRKDFIANQVLAITKKTHSSQHKSNRLTIGIYRLTMKSHSDNFRQSSIQGIMKRLSSEGLCFIVFEPLLSEGSMVLGGRVVNNWDAFIRKSDCILANRFDDSLLPVADKVYTRDIFRRD